MDVISLKENLMRENIQKVRNHRKPKKDTYDWFTSCGASDAMIFFSTPSRGQQVLTPLGSAQTTSLLVVMISIKYYFTLIKPRSR